MLASHTRRATAERVRRRRSEDPARRARVRPGVRSPRSNASKWATNGDHHMKRQLFERAGNGRARATGRLVALLAVSLVGLAACGSTGSATGQPAGGNAAAPAAPATCGGKQRTYFIAADEVRWDYAPGGSNLITGQPFGDVENTF